MKSKLIALDIDGTILDRPAGIPMPEAVRAAVAEARKSGARVCLCSSRPCYMMEDAVPLLGEIDAVIGCGGAVIVACGDVGAASDFSGDASAAPDFSGGGRVAASGARAPFHADALPTPLLSACLETAKRLGAFVTYAASGRVLVRRKGSAGDLKEATGEPVLVVMDEPELLKAFADEPFFCAYLFTEPGTPAGAVLAEPSLASASILRSSENCFIVTNKGTDKGSAVLRLAECFGIPAAAILAVGNDANDVPMLNAAGVAVAVKNASPEALAAADYVVGDVACAGAAEAIRRFAL
ncbi:MAG: Cof-type HAD-IIB family hydrolase [Clostridiales Family XIII bacterium]|nr:Cof-type HAD-IIB family hydrolase [Clostridiales Family XIII bacterium]